MTPLMQSRVNTIIREGLEPQAVSGDFAAVHTALSAMTVQHPRGKVVSADVLMALGARADTVLEAFKATPTGQLGVQMLAGEGLDFAHPLTIALVTQLEASDGITTADRNALLALGHTLSSPQADGGDPNATAADYEAAWESYQLSLLQQIITDAIEAERTTYQAAEDAAKATYTAAIAAPRQRQNRAVGWLSAYDVAGKTAAEVQAFANDILNSVDGNGSNSGDPEPLI